MKPAATTHLRTDSYLTDLIQRQFSVSLMSDAKWVRLLAALVAGHAEVKQCLVKPIWDEAAPFRHLVLNEHTQYDFDYYATAMEALVSGSPRGWYAYREIEWLDFPRLPAEKAGTAPVPQNLEVLKTLLEKAGQYALELTPDNLRLYAYYR